MPPHSPHNPVDATPPHSADCPQQKEGGGLHHAARAPSPYSILAPPYVTFKQSLTPLGVVAKDTVPLMLSWLMTLCLFDVASNAHNRSTTPPPRSRTACGCVPRNPCCLPSMQEADNSNVKPERRKYALAVGRQQPRCGCGAHCYWTRTSAARRRRARHGAVQPTAHKSGAAPPGVAPTRCGPCRERAEKPCEVVAATAAGLSESTRLAEYDYQTAIE